jgi:flagellar hook protein FlgE
MGLTSALFTGLTGLNSSQFRLDTISDNVANVNTNAYKGTRTLFQTQFARTLSSGTRPGNTEGGTNPSQIGLGSVLGSIQRNFSQGSIETTGVKTDLAIEGNGLFILASASGEQYYTRDGAFSLSSGDMLVSSDGFKVQGYGVDDEFQIVPGILKDIEIPVGSMVLSEATHNVTFDGTLDTDMGPTTQGSTVWSSPLTAGGVAATGATLLTALDDADGNAGAAFVSGNTITISGIQKGGAELDSATFTVTDTSTVDDFMDWLESMLGIDDNPALIGSPGITISAGAGPPDPGTMIVQSGAGTSNEIIIGNTNFSVDGTGVGSNPFVWSGTYAGTAGNYELGVVARANGAGTTTSLLAYDSLGNTIPITIRTVLEETTSTGNTWRFYAESAADTDESIILGNGLLRFDTNGELLSATGTDLTIQRDGAGSDTPMSIQLDFQNVRQKAVDDPTKENSVLVMSTQDGLPTGTLTDYTIGYSGIVTGFFTNGMSRDLGQIVLATFSNDEGLVARSNNTYQAGPNSGTPLTTPPLTMSAGRVLSGSLELSNVDLSREFIEMITASTGFSASSRIITTSDQLLQELLTISR